MPGWVLVAAIAASTAVLIVVAIAFFRWRWRSKAVTDTVVNFPSQLHQASNINHHRRHHHHHHRHVDIDSSSKSKLTYSLFRRGTASTRPLFSWADNPALVTDAVENGWSRFAFANYTSSPSIRSARAALLGVCATGEVSRGVEVEINWEVCQGSADFMQKIRLNSGLKKSNSSNSSMAAKSVIKTALPLPGPPLGNSSFPQEAYFEITILSASSHDSEKPKGVNVRTSEGEKAKLIQESLNGRVNSESLVHVTTSRGHGHGNSKLEELRIGGKDEGRGGEVVMVSVGLTGGGILPLKIPGTFPGSIGFNSNGSVYLDGMKLVFESERGEWGKTEKVIGCGYNPSQSKVFFTVDSELVHVVHCQSEDFGTPLYPTLAANTDILVLVNFGQSVFKYAAANTQRTPNPCFIGPLVSSPVLGYEDSKELFSMGRIDSQWLNRSATRGGYNNGNNNRGLDFDVESEGDLFEIALESSGRSPYIASNRNEL